MVRSSINSSCKLIDSYLTPQNEPIHYIIIHDDVVHVDAGNIANIFNDYFIDIGRNNANHLDYTTHINQPNSFFFRRIHCYSTEKLICSLKNKSSNLNTVPMKILKSICDIISPCLSPSPRVYLLIALKKLVWRRYRMRVINNLSNYRPISLLPVFSKVFDKVAYTQLYDYSKNNLFLHKQQYGFRAKKSTAQAILHILQYTCISIQTLVILYFLYSWIFARHLIVLTKRFCYQS